MTIDQAFENLLNTNKLPPKAKYRFRWRFKNRQLTLLKMKELLSQNGYCIIEAEKWSKL
jgi:hypothetical protein